MVKYERETIIFYALVDNYSKNCSLPTEVAYNIFAKYKLDAVSVQSVGVYSTYE